MEAPLHFSGKKLNIVQKHYAEIIERKKQLIPWKSTGQRRAFRQNKNLVRKIVDFAKKVCLEFQATIAQNKTKITMNKKFQGTGSLDKVSRNSFRTPRSIIEHFLKQQLCYKLSFSFQSQETTTPCSVRLKLIEVIFCHLPYEPVAGRFTHLTKPFLLHPRPP